jgi:hypothetical protein
MPLFLRGGSTIQCTIQSDGPVISIHVLDRSSEDCLYFVKAEVERAKMGATWADDEEVEEADDEENSENQPDWMDLVRPNPDLHDPAQSDDLGIK